MVPRQVMAIKHPKIRCKLMAIPLHYPIPPGTDKVLDPQPFLLVTSISRLYVGRDVHPVAFNIAGLTVYWYGIFAALGFLLAFWSASRRAPREGLTPEAIADLAP